VVGGSEVGIDKKKTVMKIFGIAGFKNAGKTTLVVDLVREFRARGLRVGTIKHAHHEFDIDHPGKDSFLHREAGAEEVIVASERRWAHIRELKIAAEPTLAELLTRMGDLDIVLVEGYKHGDHPKLELRRAGVAAPGLAGEGNSVVAIVSDAVIPDAPVPVLSRKNVVGIADFVWQHSTVEN
jgi:molybdopterin-guanine dinucleotide biosynthesis protein B